MRSRTAGASSRSLRAISGAWKLQPIASLKPGADERVARAAAQLLLDASAGRSCRGRGSSPGSFSSPHRRATSSIRSTSRVTSLRRNGRDGHVEAVAGVDDAELEPLEELGLLAERDLGAEQAA